MTISQSQAGVRIDYFALLEQPRRPWLDLEALQAKFFALSSHWHPDRYHQVSNEEKQKITDRFAGLNAAYHCLRDPRTRLAHLILLETGTGPNEVQTIGKEMMDLSLEIGQACQRADRLHTERVQATSAIRKAQIFQELLMQTERLREITDVLNGRGTELERTIRTMDAEWHAADLSGNVEQKGLLLQRMEEIYRELSYLHRWAAQTRERVIREAAVS